MLIDRCQKRHNKKVHESLRNKTPSNLARQLGIFADKNGLLRCMGRLEYTELSESAKQPILLPQKERFTYLLIDKVHRKILHSGVSQTLNEVRMTYWIPHGRAVVRSRIKECRICRRAEEGSNMLLNSASKIASHTFNAISILPFYVKENASTSKICICLFTYLVTRAVHLETVKDMSTQTFIMRLRRFIAIRGTPFELISDNAKYFKLTSVILPKIWESTIYNTDVQNYVSNEKIN